MLACPYKSLRNGQRMRKIWYVSHTHLPALLHEVCLRVALQLIMPGYCVAGTVGHKVLGGAKKIEIDKKMVNVRLSVQYMSFRSVSSSAMEWCVASCGDGAPLSAVHMLMPRGSCNSSDRYPPYYVNLKDSTCLHS